MEELKKEIVVYSGVCRCCLQEETGNNFLGLWDPHFHDGNVEVYGRMITECFTIPWEEPDNPDANVEQICENCVSKVRDAFSFKRQLLAAENQLAQHFDQVKEEDKLDGSDMVIQIHTDCTEQLIEQTETNLQTPKQCDGREKDEGNYENQSEYKDEIDVSENVDSEYENIHFIEEDDASDKHDIDQDIQEKETVNDINVPKRPWGNTRMNYRPIDMDNAVRCVTQGLLSAARAAEKYGVPKKTIASRIRKMRNLEKLKNMEIKKTSLKEKADPEEDINGSEAKMKKLIDEIMKILTFTNATPYKTTKSSYGCVYCNLSAKSTTFEDPEELRIHTRVEHANERIQAVKDFMKPYIANEILKVDIYNLICTVCCKAITGWMEMFEHLNKEHYVEFKEAYTRVIPFSLDVSNYKCAICKEKFHNYPHLNTHVNCHYNNYACADCGDTFLTYSRIKIHMKVHDTGRFPCDYPGCGKVFNQKRYKKKHYMLMHTDEKKLKCLYCKLKFHDGVKRHDHVKQHHKEKVTQYTCDLCGMVFDWKTNYYNHMRKKHKDCSMKCQYCEVVCTNKNLLRKHLVVHGDLTNFCDICNNSYSSQIYLKRHKWRVHGIESTPSLIKMEEEESISSE